MSRPSASEPSTAVADSIVAGVVVGAAPDRPDVEWTADELRLARERAEAIARFPEENPHPVLRIDCHGNVPYANASARAALAPLRLNVARAAPDALLEPARRALGEGYWLASEVVSGDRIFLMTFVPVGGEVNVYGTDITLRKRAEGALRRSEHRFRTLTENAPDYVTRHDRELRLLYANPAVTRALACEIEDILGKSVAEVGLPAAAAAAWERNLSEVLASGRPVRFELSVPWKGDVRWWDVSMVPESAPGGPVDSVLATSRDITDRKHAEERLQRSRESLRRLLETSIQILGEKRLDAVVQIVSDAALELTHARLAILGHGYVDGQFAVGRSSRAGGAPASIPVASFAMDVASLYANLVGGRDALRLGEAQVRADGRWRGLGGHGPVRGLLAVRLCDADGRISGMLVVMDREAGEFTVEDESLLRQLAAVASLALQHVEARLDLEEAARHKDEFIAMLSHELRNPLAPIRNGLYILERAAPGGEQARRAHAVMDRQVAHMTRLVDDLLDVTRISRGKIQLRIEDVDLADLVQRTVEDHRAAFVNNGVALEVTVRHAPLSVGGDATRLAQVVGNLLQNAAKFTGKGGHASVDVAADRAAGVATVTVRDSGVGIGREMLPRLFEPFAQADRTLDRSRGGLGLGLALVKSVVELHGGRVSARSDGPGTGAEFAFTIPLQAPSAAAERGAASRSGSGGRRVLVVEDSPDAADTLRDVLELGGHSVTAVYDGATALAEARRLVPDVVLCDIGLPGMDGYQIARALRCDPALRSTYLVALTGYAMSDDHERARAAGFDEHLAKPASAERLEALLARVPRGAG